jgi:hypothetical protein
MAQTIEQLRLDLKLKKKHSPLYYMHQEVNWKHHVWLSSHYGGGGFAKCCGMCRYLRPYSRSGPYCYDCTIWK